MSEQPNTITNFTYLRSLCLQQLLKDPLGAWSDRELHKIGELLQEHAGNLAKQRKLVNDDWRENQGLCILNRDLEELEVDIPKWVSLVSWLTPESVAGSYPELIDRIAKLALSRTLDPPTRDGR